MIDRNRNNEPEVCEACGGTGWSSGHFVGYVNGKYQGENMICGECCGVGHPVSANDPCPHAGGPMRIAWYRARHEAGMEIWGKGDGDDQSGNRSVLSRRLR